MYYDISCLSPSTISDHLSLSTLYKTIVAFKICECRTDNAVKNRYWSALRSRQRKAKKEAKKRAIAAKAQEIEEEQRQHEVKKMRTSDAIDVPTAAASSAPADEDANIEHLMSSNAALEASLAQGFEAIPSTSSHTERYSEEFDDKKPSAEEKISFSI